MFSGGCLAQPVGMLYNVLMTMCTKCGNERDDTDFYVKSNGSLRKPCKFCLAARTKAYREAHLDGLKQARQVRYWVRGEREAVIAAYAENPEPAKERARAWGRKNRQRKADNQASYQKANRAYYNHINRQRKIGRTVPDELDKQAWLDLVASRNGRCFKCGANDEITLDHVEALANGGRHHISNVQPLCRPCNSAKGTKYEDYRCA